MQNYWLRASNAENVIVFVLGWGCDHAVVEHLATSLPDSCDILCIYDYRVMGQAPDLNKYERKYLFAWSFGVWVAEQIFAGNETCFTRAIAFCGSPYPVDERYGIAPKRLQITIKGFARVGTDEFNKRTYGVFYDRIASQLNCRDLQSNVDELIALYHASLQSYTAKLIWDRAIIGSEDVIFSCENLKHYWGIRGEVLPLQHYPFEDANLILRELDFR